MSVGHLSAGETALAIAAVTAGAAIQGSIGFGLALVAAPALALIEPRALPATLLFLALPLTSFMAFRERGAIDRRGFLEMTAGRVLGTGGGAAILLAVPTRSLSVLLGALIVTAAGLSALRPEFEARSGARVAAGVASGVMGTAAAIGGPALALVYQRRPAPELRATLALSFVVGLVMSLVAIGIGGKVEGGHALLALKLVPGLAAGVAASGWVARRLEERWLRAAVLAFAFASGAAAVARGLAA